MAIVRLLFPITAPEQDRQNATMRKRSPIPRLIEGFEDEGFCVVEEVAAREHFAFGVAL
jgi:hypothetical protein